VEDINHTLKKYAYSEQYHWWHRARRRIILELLSKYTQKLNINRIIDIGCGTGGMLLHLNKFNVGIFGIDNSQDMVMFCKARGYTNVICASAENIPFYDNSFDIITMLDVLEHIPDDIKVLQELIRICRPDGIMLLTVPAYQFLWGRIDEICGHKRRYTRKDIKRKLEATGWCIEKISYMNVLLFPGVWIVRHIYRIISKVSANRVITNSPFDKIYPLWINRLLEMIFVCELPFIKRWDMWFGVSIICIVKKSGRYLKLER
jgi:SAM-dependent methyltransferase